MSNTPNVLELHGTKLSVLKPSAVAHAAEADLRRRARNIGGENNAGNYEHYAFHRKHVVKAKSAAGLIEAALADLACGVESGKKSTRLIYKDKNTLVAALEIVIDNLPNNKR